MIESTLEGDEWHETVAIICKQSIEHQIHNDIFQNK